MTKARDLANASTALSAVSATELGYLDGVTSAVQTQLNAKAADSGNELRNDSNTIVKSTSNRSTLEKFTPSQSI